MTVLVASRLKIPASTTHCVVGSVFAVGLADGIKAVNWRYVPSPHKRYSRPQHWALTALS